MHQAVFDTSEICAQLGVQYAVFSPGSRNAPLSISFNRNSKIKKFIFLDERSAGFIGLGIAQQTKTPVVLCCTSGTALLNYGPAIAEAFYQNIPLIIFSADRPPEWIDQWDGQTIRQQNVFDNHIKGFYQLPVDLEHKDAQWEYHRKLNEAINLASTGPKGPVHINVPFREPFYPPKGEKYHFTKDLNLNITVKGDGILTEDQQDRLLKEWNAFGSKAIILGHGNLHKRGAKLLEVISSEQNIPVIADVISNGHSIKNAIRHQDLFLQRRKNRENLRPNFILTLGKSVIAKNLKLFLREKPPMHWHLDNNAVTSDPFQSLPRCICADPVKVLELLSKGQKQDETFEKSWKSADRSVSEILKTTGELPYSEPVAFQEVMKKIPAGTDIHLANSMPVRWANFFGVKSSDIRIYANRGTSGIDGTNGTTVGHALITNRRVVLLTGDLGLLYDRNAFLHAYDVSNLTIVVFNNFGGGIFDLIPGPSDLPRQEREDHFVTPHGKDFKSLAQEAGFSYIKANDEVTLDLALSSVFEAGTKPKLLEIQSDPKMNKSVYFELKRLVNE